jgi:hypothetical protein
MELFYDKTETDPIFCEILRVNNFCVKSLEDQLLLMMKTSIITCC